MQFRFQPLRATQAANHLARLAGGRLNYTKLIKLLHLADRQSLLETGAPITGDCVVNMANGPVLSQVYDCIKNNARDCSSWNSHLRTDGYDVVVTADAGDSELSDYDVSILEALHSQYRSYDWREMIDVVHRLPEWKDPAPASMRPVSHEEILRASGATSETVRVYEHLNASVRQVDDLRVIRS